MFRLLAGVSCVFLTVPTSQGGLLSYDDSMWSPIAVLARPKFVESNSKQLVNLPIEFDASTVKFAPQRPGLWDFQRSNYFSTKHLKFYFS